MVFIALVGTSSSGKGTICEFLVRKHGFKREPKTSASTTLSSLTLAPSPLDIANPLSFSTSESLLNFATKNWQESYVTLDLDRAEELDAFVKRPFFLVVGVDGPVGRRFERARERSQLRGQDLTLQQFINNHDFDMTAASDHSDFHTPSGGPIVNPRPLDQHNPSPTSSSFPFNHARSSPSTAHSGRGPRALLEPKPFGEGFPGSRPVAHTSADGRTRRAGGVRRALVYAQVMVLNNFESKEELWRHLDDLDLLNGERLRPGWDTYFMTLASLASLRSNCMKRRVGALLVRSKRILSTGYNGTPRGLTNCNEGGCARCNGAANGGQGLAECLCLHAEENALLEVGRERIGEDSILYCNTCPCLTCSVKIVQTGVKEVVYNLNYSMDEASARVLREGGVILRQLVMPSATT